MTFEIISFGGTEENMSWGEEREMILDVAKATCQTVMHPNAHVGNARAARIMGGIHFLDPPFAVVLSAAFLGQGSWLVFVPRPNQADH